jgi:D-sedoheptulose 7-phosphate isomerase
MREQAQERLLRHVTLAQALASGDLPAEIAAAASDVATRCGDGGRLLAFGNGGSAADAEHLVGEFTGRFLFDRPPLPAVALADNGSAVTAIANDYGFDQVFARQVRALGGAGDTAVALSTSGGSPNVLEGLRAARELGMLTVGVTGSRGASMGELCDHLLVIPTEETPQIQEGTILVLHTLAELVERRLFGE